MNPRLKRFIWPKPNHILLISIFEK